MPRIRVRRGSSFQRGGRRVSIRRHSVIINPNQERTFAVQSSKTGRTIGRIAYGDIKRKSLIRRKKPIRAIARKSGKKIKLIRFI